MVSRSNWWRRTFQRFRRTSRRSYRRWPERSLGLLIESLEDRTLLSAVVFTGRNLSWNGFGATMGANAAEMSVDGSGMLILHDASGENISLTNQPLDWSGNGTPTVMGLLSDVDAITIDGTAPTPTDQFTLLNIAAGTINLTGSFAVTGFDTITVNNSLTTTAGNSVSLTANATATSSLAVGPGVAIAADTQSYRAGAGTGTTAAADLTTNLPAPTFTDNSGLLPPSVFTYRQDADIAAAAVPDANQFAGFLPTTYTIQSDGGSITTPTTTTITSPSANLILNAQTGVTFDWALDIASLTIMAGGDISVTSLITTSGDVGLTAGGAITEPGGAITANQLTTSSGTSTDLGGANMAAIFQATNSTSGAITFNDVAAPLTLNAITQTGGGDVTVTNTGGDLDVNGKITMTGGILQLTSDGVVNINAAIDPPATVIISAFGDANINNAVTATDLIQVMAGQDPTTHTGNVNVNVGGSLTQSTAGHTGIELSTGTTAGSITLTGFLNAQDSVLLTATNNVTETGAGGTIAAAGVSLIGGTGTFNLSQANVVGTLAGNFTGALTFTDTIALTVGTVFGTLGLNSNGNNIILTVNAGASLLTIGTAANGQSITATGATVDIQAGGVTENTNAIITAASLRLQGTGTFALAQANVVGTLAGNFTGALTFSDTTALTVGTVLGTAGLNSNGNAITLTVNSGASLLTIGTAANGQSITATGATVDIQAGGVTENTNAIITAASLRLQGTGTFALTQANVVGTLAGNFTGALTFTDTIALLVGTVLTTAGLNSNGNAITLTVNTGASLLTIGTAANGQSITATGAIVDIQAGGVTENTNAIITAASLRLRGTGTFALAQANVVGTLAGNFTGALTFTDATALTVGTVLGTAGLNSNGNAITVTVNGANQLTIGTAANGQSITATGATVDIQAGGVTENTNAIITAASLRLQGTGTFTLAQANAVGTLAGNFTGALTFTDTIALTVGTVLGTAGLNSNGNAITLTVNGANQLTIGTASNGQSITATGATVDLLAGAISENTNAIITAASLRLQGTGAFALAQANVVGTLAGNFTGTLTFNDTTALTVSTVLGTAGLNSNGNAITLTLNGGLGLLTINTPAGPGIVATGAIVDLNVGGINEASAGSIITAASLRLQGTGTFNLNPTNPNTVATLAGNFTGALTFKDNSPNPTGLTVGTVLGTLGLTSANSNITLCNTGDILLNQPVNAGTNAGAVTVRLKSGGSVTQGTGLGAMGTITADNLGVDAVGSVILDKFANNVSVFAARGSAVSIRFAGLFSLGTVAPANVNDCFTSTITGIMAPAGGPQDITICQDTGTLTITMALNAGTGTVRLVASNGGVTQAAGASITAAALGVRATSNASVVTGGDIALDVANNNVGTFAALNTDANRWAIRFLNTNPAGTLVGTITAAAPCFIQTAGVDNTNGDVTLNSSSGATLLTIGSGSGEGITATGGTVDLFTGGATEAAGSIITATNLRLRSAGPGPFTFSLGQTNAVSSMLAGNFFGPLAFTNNAAITIASITLNAVTTADLNSNGSNVTLTLNNGLGLLTINTPTGMGIRAGTATVDLNAGGVTEATATSIITAGGLRLQGTGTFALNQPNVISQGILPGILVGNFIGVLNFTNTTALNVSTLLGTSGLTSNGNNITLTLNGGMSPLTIDTPAGPVPGIVAQAAILDINAGGATELTATSTITAASLRLQGTGNFNLGQSNTVNTIAGNFTGNLNFADSIPLTVGTVLGTAGLTSTTGSVTLNVVNGSGALSIGTPPAGGEGIHAANGTVALFAGGAAEATGSTITAVNLLIVSAAGGPFAFNLNQNNSVGTIAGFVSGDIIFVNTGTLVVGTVAAPTGIGSLAGLVSTAGNISLTVGGGTAQLFIGTPPPAAGGESIYAPKGTVELFAGGAVEAAGSVIIAYKLLVRSAAVGGPYTFQLAQNNTVINLAGNFTGTLAYVNTIAMLVDTVASPSGAGTVAGLTSGNGNIILSIANGSALLVIGTPPAGGEGINAGTGSVQLVAGSMVEETGSTITAHNLVLGSSFTGGPFILSLGQNNAVDTLAGSVGSDLVFADSRPLTVGTVMPPTGGANVFGLLDIGHTATLIVGGGMLPLTITATLPIEGITATTVDLDAGGVTETGGSVNAINLRLRSAVGGPFPFTLTTFFNGVGVIAGDFYGPLTYSMLLGSVDTVLGTAGLNSHGSNITLNLASPLTVNQAINAGTTGNVSITVSQSLIFNNDAPITANAASLQGMISGFRNPPALTVNYSGLVDTTWTVTGANAGNIANSRFIITSSPQVITFTNFQTLIGGAGADTFIFNDGATLSGSIDGGQGTVAGKIDTIDWSRYTTPRMVRVVGPATHGVFGTELSLGGQPGFTDIDRLIGSGAGGGTLTGPDHNNTWAITGPNSGTLTTDYGGGVMSQVSFAGFPNLKGGSLIDNFVFQNAGQVTGSIDGGGIPAGFQDTLDWSNTTTDRLVGIAGFGPLHGYAGSALAVNSFTDIDQVIGSATTMQNALFGENQDRTWIIGVNNMGTNVQGVYGPANLSPALFFLNFQTLVGGSGTDTFDVNATPAGKTVTLFGGDGNDVFNVGTAANSLDPILGPLAIDGGRASSTTSPSLSATVSCPAAPGQAANARPAVTQTATWVSGGNVLNIGDMAGASGTSGLTYNLGRSNFSRKAAGLLPVGVSFFSVETINLTTNQNANQTVNVTDTAVIDSTNPGALIHSQTTVQVSGANSNTVNVFNTGDSSALFLNATGTTGIGIFHTGVNSYTKVMTVNASIFQAGSGMASILDLNGASQVNFMAQPAGSSSGSTGPNSVTRVLAAGVIRLLNADPTSGLSLNGSQVNVGLFNNPTSSYPAHPLAAAVVSITGPGVLTFVNAANQPSTLNTAVFRFLAGTGGGANLITSPDETAVYLCATNVSLPQATFVAAAFLLPNQFDASDRPVANIVLSSQLAGSFQFQNFALPPVVASPNFANPFGFGPPSVAVADVNGDGIPDLIVGAGPGFAPLVEVFDGRTVLNSHGAQQGVLAQFFAYDSRFVGGVNVAAGHIDPTTPNNAIITGTGRGGLPLVEAFLLGGPSNPNAFPVGGAILIRYFLAYQNTLGGVRVASGNFNGVTGSGAHDDIVTAPGPGDAPNVRVFSGTDTSQPPQLLRSFFAYNPAFLGGVDVAVGHLLGDAFDDIVTAPASAGTTQINVFNGQTGALQSEFSAFPNARVLNGVGGVAVDVSAGTPRIIVGSALGQPSQVLAFDVTGNHCTSTSDCAPLVFLDAAGNMIQDPFFNAFGTPISGSNLALVNYQAVAVGGRSR